MVKERSSVLLIQWYTWFPLWYQVLRIYFHDLFRLQLILQLWRPFPHLRHAFPPSRIISQPSLGTVPTIVSPSLFSSSVMKLPTARSVWARWSCCCSVAQSCLTLYGVDDLAITSFHSFLPSGQILAAWNSIPQGRARRS